MFEKLSSGKIESVYILRHAPKDSNGNILGWNDKGVEGEGSLMVIDLFKKMLSHISDTREKDLMLTVLNKKIVFKTFFYPQYSQTEQTALAIKSYADKEGALMDVLPFHEYSKVKIDNEKEECYCIFVFSYENRGIIDDVETAFCGGEKRIPELCCGTQALHLGKNGGGGIIK